MIKLKRAGKSLIFDNGYWQVTHDLKQSGAICEVRFPLDDGKNFLARPLEVRNGAFSSLSLLEQRDSVRRTRRIRPRQKARRPWRQARRLPAPGTSGP